MLERVIKFVFFLSQLRDAKIMYYKSATINGKSGCVEANISSKMANKLKASPGRCSDVRCFTYSGQHNILGCCTVACFTCEAYI